MCSYFKANSLYTSKGLIAFYNSYLNNISVFDMSENVLGELFSFINFEHFYYLLYYYGLIKELLNCKVNLKEYKKAFKLYKNKEKSWTDPVYSYFNLIFNERVKEIPKPFSNKDPILSYNKLRVTSYNHSRSLLRLKLKNKNTLKFLVISISLIYIRNIPVFFYNFGNNSSILFLIGQNASLCYSLFLDNILIYGWSELFGIYFPKNLTNEHLSRSFYLKRPKPTKGCLFFKQILESFILTKHVRVFIPGLPNCIWCKTFNSLSLISLYFYHYSVLLFFIKW